MSQRRVVGRQAPALPGSKLLQGKNQVFYPRAVELPGRVHSASIAQGRIVVAGPEVVVSGGRVLLFAGEGLFGLLPGYVAAQDQPKRVVVVVFGQPPL